MPTTIAAVSLNQRRLINSIDGSPGHWNAGALLDHARVDYIADLHTLVRRGLVVVGRPQPNGSVEPTEVTDTDWGALDRLVITLTAAGRTWQRNDSMSQALRTAGVHGCRLPLVAREAGLSVVGVRDLAHDGYLEFTAETGEAVPDHTINANWANHGTWTVRATDRGRWALGL